MGTFEWWNYVPRSRRHVLRSGVVFAAALAGCVSDSPPLGGDGETTTQGPTATDASTQTAATPTETQTPAYDTSVLTTSASVVTQATADHPAVVKLRLTNEGEEAIPIQPTEGGGYPLEYFPTLDGSETNLVLYPREPTHWQFFGGDELADSQTNGCWRFVTEEGEKPREGSSSWGLR
ncbi:hypothetical protein ACFQH3_04100 [Haladaptatus sp. GCM10025707]|uniref:hypothetical protein n=1 Tax=unclassified Haladaptatus TaxID=2622732 RepID=UPI0036070F85